MPRDSGLINHLCGRWTAAGSTAARGLGSPTTARLRRLPHHAGGFVESDDAAAVVTIHRDSDESELLYLVLEVATAPGTLPSSGCRRRWTGGTDKPPDGPKSRQFGRSGGRANGWDAPEPVHPQMAVVLGRRDVAHVVETNSARSSSTSAAANGSVTYTSPGGVTGSIRAVRLTWDPMKPSASSTGSWVGNTGPTWPPIRRARWAGSPTASRSIAAHRLLERERATRCSERVREHDVDGVTPCVAIPDVRLCCSSTSAKPPSTLRREDRQLLVGQLGEPLDVAEQHRAHDPARRPLPLRARSRVSVRGSRGWGVRTDGGRRRPVVGVPDARRRRPGKPT